MNLFLRRGRQDSVMLHNFVMNTVFICNYLMSIGGFVGYKQNCKVVGIVIYIICRNKIYCVKFVGKRNILIKNIGNLWSEIYKFKTFVAVFRQRRRKTAVGIKSTAFSGGILVKFFKVLLKKCAYRIICTVKFVLRKTLIPELKSSICKTALLIIISFSLICVIFC